MQFSECSFVSEICLVDNAHNTIHISICVDFHFRLYLLKFWCLIAGAGRAVWKEDKTDAVASIDAWKFSKIQPQICRPICTLQETYVANSD